MWTSWNWTIFMALSLGVSGTVVCDLVNCDGGHTWGAPSVTACLRSRSCRCSRASTPYRRRYRRRALSFFRFSLSFMDRPSGPVSRLLPDSNTDKYRQRSELWGHKHDRVWGDFLQMTIELLGKQSKTWVISNLLIIYIYLEFHAPLCGCEGIYVFSL